MWLTIRCVGWHLAKHWCWPLHIRKPMYSTRKSHYDVCMFVFDFPLIFPMLNLDSLQTKYWPHLLTLGDWLFSEHFQRNPKQSNALLMFMKSISFPLLVRSTDMYTIEHKRNNNPRTANTVFSLKWTFNGRFFYFSGHFTE